MAASETPSLRESVAITGVPRFLWDGAAFACYTALDRATSLGDRLADLAGRAVLVATTSQLTTALALIELDGIARRLVILPPDIEDEQLTSVIGTVGIDAVIVDDERPNATLTLPICATCSTSVVPMTKALPATVRTEWVLMTSGTTGAPKMVAHDLAGLAVAIRNRSPADGAPVWGTFYDIRRYGGLQIFLRAVLGGASLVLSMAGEPVAEHLGRLAKHGVTHLSGTPSQWRRALMKSCYSRYRATLRAALGRDRGPGNPGQSAQCISRRGDRPRLRDDRGRRRFRCQRWYRRLSRRLYWSDPQWGRNESS